MMARWVARWVAFWDVREPPTCLALSRILFGSVLFADLMTAELAGLVPDMWAPPPSGLGVGMLQEAAPLSVQWLGASAHTAQSVWWVALVTTVCVTVGVALLPAGLILAFALAELARFTPSGDRGIDVLLRVAALVFALSRAADRWSLTSWFRARLGHLPAPDAPAWPRYVLFAQLIWLYFSAAHNRSDPAWWPWGGFSALGLVLSDPHYARFMPGWAEWLAPVTRLATVGTMLFEGGAPLLLFLTWCDRNPARGGRVGGLVRRWKLRWAWLAVGVTLHIGIALTLKLGIFSFGVLALYPLLVHPDELHTAWSWVFSGKNKCSTRPSLRPRPSDER